MSRTSRSRSKDKVAAMVSVYVTASCGCCTEELKFKSYEAATAAFERAALSSVTTIVDDAGVAHDHLDTFYGFSKDAESQSSRDLTFLAERTFGF